MCIITAGTLGWLYNFSLLVSFPFPLSCNFHLTVLVLCTMRIYALYNKNNYVLLALTTLAVSSVVVGFVRTFPGHHATLR
jgi:hypothetical protein